ncbi:MAG: diaminopimelate epimerase [Bacteroidetes bacterium HGW-Bacteroidetes-17]|jgi:diaminopimelate epimerase|nr:MAG: diaminopimelate epimerase [Bacteroidetes bacterium HGW-Bacteroidetes-17]
MTLAFHKYQGAGNDFIIIDGRDESLSLSNSLIKTICDRKFGVGADGLMILRKHKDLDFRMIYYNSDGMEGSMCGNGGRCILAFAKKIGIAKNYFHFMAIDGLHEGEILEYNGLESMVRLKMSDVNEFKKEPNYYLTDTGSPHYIEFLKNLQSKDVYEDGKEIRNNDQFREKGINVNFVEEASGHLFVRTFERGVENETLSCGTGVTASALAFAIEQNIKKGSVQIQTLGGKLKVSFEREGYAFRNVWLEGPATFVFNGEISI